MKIYLLNHDRTVADEFTLLEPLTRMGREEDNDVQLLVGGVSRYHCEFEFDGFEWLVRDLGSTNGTKVNNRMVSPAANLRAGDLLDVGEQLIRFGEIQVGQPVPAVSKGLNIFDAPNVLSSAEMAKVIVPGENEVEQLTDTVIETPIPIISSPSAKGNVSTTDDKVIIATGMPPLHDMAATAISNSIPGALNTQYSTTATVRTPVPSFEPKADGAPMVIINLPGQGSEEGGNIVFEPLPESTPVVVVPPTSKEDYITPTILTPAPENIAEKIAVSAVEKAPPLSAEKVVVAKDDAPDKTKHVDFKLSDKMSIFSGKKENRKNIVPENGEAQPKRKISNLLFYTMVVCTAVIFISLFIIFQKNKQERAVAGKTSSKQEYPLLLVYEKKIISRDNIFFFSMTLDNSTVKLTLDDLKSQRHYVREDRAVKPELIADLLAGVKATDFMELQAQTAGTPHDGVDEFRRLIVGYDNRLQVITVDNNFAPSSFEKIEQAINEFADGYGLQTIALTPAELKKEAEVAFNKAEELFLNRDSDPQNLSKSIKRYQLALEYLDQFAPKPKQWDMARKRIDEAKEILEKRLQDLKFDYQRQMKLQEHEERMKTIDKMLPLLDPGSKDYEKYRSVRAKLEIKLKKDAKR